MLTSEWTHVDGQRMHARVAAAAPADAPSLVCVHGLGVSSRYMTPLLRALQPHARAYAPDLPGFGRSRRPGVVLDTEGLADALVRWMDLHDLRGSALLGNSYGCQVVAAALDRDPQVAARAVLQGPTMDAAARTAPQQVARWLADAPRERASLAPIVLSDYLACGTRRLVRTFRHARRDRIEERLPRIRVPTLVVRGALDPIVPGRWAAEVARRLPRGRLVVMPGVAHAANHSAPRALAQVVLPFLEEDAAAS